MEKLTQVLDEQLNVRHGENGHVEYTWSEETEAIIVQLSFQLVRGAPDKVIDEFHSLMNRLHKANNTKYLLIVYKLTAQIRDIIAGKGEYKLFYDMLIVWYKFYPLAAKNLLKYNVSLYGYEGQPIHPYGSWKDIKYFIRAVQRTSMITEDRKKELIDKANSYLLEQLRKDEASYESGNILEISLASRWVPRERSSFGEQFPALAEQYFSKYIDSAKKSTKNKARILSKAKRKAKQHFRQVCAKLSRALNTIQINQCEGTWSDIDPNNITSITRRKQTRAFQNITKKCEQRSQTADRIQCAIRYKEHICKAMVGSKDATIKGKRTSIYDMVKEAISLPVESTEEDSTLRTLRDELNLQWKDNASQNANLGNLIPMCDVSSSMTIDHSLPIFNAIGLSIRIAEKSNLKNRILTFSSKPSWVNLDDCKDFHSKVKKLEKAEWGGNTNFYWALKRILEAVCEAGLSPDEVKDMVLVILSDMHIDASSDQDYESVLQGRIKEEYAAAGQQMYGEPFLPPHLLFWNLHSTSGFPTLTTEKSVSMLSGFSPVMLNLFCDKGVEALESATPWTILLESLDNPRYQILSETAFIPSL
jgi:hypothetical protein